MKNLTTIITGGDNDHNMVISTKASTRRDKMIHGPCSMLNSSNGSLRVVSCHKYHQLRLMAIVRTTHLLSDNWCHRFLLLFFDWCSLIIAPGWSLRRSIFTICSCCYDRLLTAASFITASLSLSTRSPCWRWHGAQEIAPLLIITIRRAAWTRFWIITVIFIAVIK